MTVRDQHFYQFLKLFIILYQILAEKTHLTGAEQGLKIWGVGSLLNIGLKNESRKKFHLIYIAFLSTNEPNIRLIRVIN